MKRPLNILAIGLGLFWVPLLAAAHVAASPTTTQEVREVALTFDDGPYGTSTQEVIDILQQEHVSATFFLIGKNVEEYPALAKEEVQDGFVVGNHTYDHTKHLTHMKEGQVQQELTMAENAIASSTGIHATLFRPPYGSLTKKLRAEIEHMGYTVVLWNVDPKDWDYASSTSQVIEQHILTHLKPHMIIVFHDGRDVHVDYPRDNLIGALPTVIEELKQQGYAFVTADKLVANK